MRGRVFVFRSCLCWGKKGKDERKLYREGIVCISYFWLLALRIIHTTLISTGTFHFQRERTLAQTHN